MAPSSSAWYRGSRTIVEVHPRQAQQGTHAASRRTRGRRNIASYIAGKIPPNTGYPSADRDARRGTPLLEAKVESARRRQFALER